MILCEAVYQGPGTAGTEQYMLEIILIIFGAFLLGYLFRFFLNDGMKKKISALESQLADQKAAESEGDSERENELKAEIKKLEDKVERLNKDLSNSISEKIQLKHDLQKAKDDLLHQPKAVESEPLKNSAPHNEEVAKEDLTKIEGIGPKIAQILGEGGIQNFAQLANSDPGKIKEVLMTAGPNYAVHNPTTWPEQARLAVKGAWDELAKLQEELKGGRRK